MSRSSYAKSPIVVTSSKGGRKRRPAITHPTCTNPSVHSYIRVVGAWTVAASTSERDYCQWDTFNASCDSTPHHVILMTSARYGRMNAGRSVEAAFHDTDTDILARILARMQACRASQRGCRCRCRCRGMLPLVSGSVWPTRVCTIIIVAWLVLEWLSADFRQIGNKLFMDRKSMGPN